MLKKNFTRWDDAVLDNRNKNYGAYLIRHAYEKNLSKASFYGAMLIAVLFFMYYATKLLHQNPVVPEVIRDGIVCTLTDPLIIPDPPVQKPVYASQHTTPTNVQPKVVITEPVNPPSVETQLTTSSTGEGNGTDVQLSGDVGTAATTVAVVAEPPKVFDHAEIMPEFEGGLKGLYKFLRKNLHYPSASRSIGEEGTVYVRFIVDAAGVVTGVEVAKGVSGSLDREASRVVALMPKWKPGRQRENPVNVRMMLPIKFALNGE